MSIIKKCRICPWECNFWPQKWKCQVQFCFDGDNEQKNKWDFHEQWYFRKYIPPPPPPTTIYDIYFSWQRNLIKLALKTKFVILSVSSIIELFMLSVAQKKCISEVKEFWSWIQFTFIVILMISGVHIEDWLTKTWRCWRQILWTNWWELIDHHECRDYFLCYTFPPPPFFWRNHQSPVYTMNIYKIWLGIRRGGEECKIFISA